MRLNTLTYPGNGTVQPGITRTDNAGESVDGVVFTNIFVHSNIDDKSPLELRLDIAAIERQARAARSAWVGSRLKAFYRFLLGKFGCLGGADMKPGRVGKRSRPGVHGIREYERMQPRCP